MSKSPPDVVKDEVGVDEDKPEPKEHWEEVHGGHVNPFTTDPTVQTHLRERNDLWRKIHQTKKFYRKAVASLQEVEDELKKLEHTDHDQ